MLERLVEVENQLGLHARAASKLVKLATSFDCNVTLTREDNHAVADAKSILSILTISASIGTSLIVRVEGRGESAALDQIAQLFSERFGES
jgi:phosphotransferase system HPr (HPr) family protein